MYVEYVFHTGVQSFSTLSITSPADVLDTEYESTNTRDKIPCNTIPCIPWNDKYR